MSVYFFNPFDRMKGRLVVVVVVNVILILGGNGVVEELDVMSSETEAISLRLRRRERYLTSYIRILTGFDVL